MLSRGIIYLSRVPPYMKPEKVRHLMSKYGKVGKLFLKEEDPSSRKRRVQTGGSRKKYYVEGQCGRCSVIINNNNNIVIIINIIIGPHALLHRLG